MPTSAAVVRALRAWETVHRPAKRPTIHAHEGILLLETEPGDLGSSSVHDFLRRRTMVRLIRRTIVVVGLRHHKDVVTTTEGVFEDSRCAEVDIGIFALSLVGRGAIEVPLTELADVGDLLAYGLAQRSQVDEQNQMRRIYARLSQRTVVFERSSPSPSIQTSIHRKTIQ